MSDYWCVKLSCGKFPCAAFKAAAATPVALEFCVLCGAEIVRDTCGRLEPHVRRFVQGLGFRRMHADCLNDAMQETLTEAGAHREFLYPPEGTGGPPERLPGCVPEGYEEVDGWLVRMSGAPTTTATAASTALGGAVPRRSGPVKAERSEVADMP